MNINRKIFYLIFIMVLIHSPISYAVEENDLGMGRIIFKFFFYIFIIFGVIIITIYGTKFIARNSKRFINSRYINILDRINLDNNTKIIIVEISNFIYILAISNNNVETVDKIPIKDFAFKEDLKFEEQLERHKNKYIKNEDFPNFRTKVEEIAAKWDKFFNKEDENDEEK